jgi:hypothetical protein
MAPIVSIVTATRNRPHLLRQALLSIKQQSYTEFEAVVVDDGSSPETHEQYRDLWKELDGRFVLHLASPPGGPGSDPGRGRNFGVRAAAGEIVAFLDHDDFWVRPDHLGAGVEAMQQHGAGYYFTHVRFEPEQPGLMWAVRPDVLAAGARILADPLVVEVPVADFVRVMTHSHIHPSHSMVRRATWQQASGFIEGLKTADDVNFMLRIADLAPGILYRPDPCVAIRMPEGKSFSLSSPQIAQTLAEHQAMLDLRSRCGNPDVRRCARAREAWVLRQLASQISGPASGEAWRLALQSVTTYPTLGGAWFLAKSIARSFSGAAVPAAKSPSS